MQTTNFFHDSLEHSEDGGKREEPKSLMASVVKYVQEFRQATIVQLVRRQKSTWGSLGTSLAGCTRVNSDDATMEGLEKADN